MITGFKNFILRGNVVDLAVAVVIGAAFAAVVDALVAGFINPLISAIFAQPNLAEVWTFTINGGEFSIGLILDATISFLLIATAVYFVVVLPMNTLAARRKGGTEPEPETPSEDVLLLQEIRDLLAARRDV